MTGKTIYLRTTAISIAASFVLGTALPVATASAHDRHNGAKHYGYGTTLTKNGHRKFHNVYGRGANGQHVYHSRYQGHHHKKHKRKRKKHDNGDLIAAGIIGLAVGAIIASESSKNRNHHKPSYQYNEPYQGSNNGVYNNGGYNGGSYNGGGYNGGQHIPLNDYDGRSYTDTGGPNVITYNDDYSLEPWTPGWQRWCQNRYRSFNARTGTFRGYDGRDHFCVPK
ncbi:MAG: BA14K family protein [Rhizobiaceae bacterium]